MNEKQVLKKKIQQTELQIKKLSMNSTDSEVCCDLTNSLILQKAVLKKQLENLEKNFIIEKFKAVFPHKEKLICDYFHNA